MALATEIGFPLDIYDGAPSHEGFRGNSRRLTKAEIIHLVNRHAVNLADDCALGIPRVS